MNQTEILELKNSTNGINDALEWSVCAQSCQTLCDSMDFVILSLPGSSVHEISQAEILERVAISFSRDLPDLGIKPASPALAGGFFTTSTTWETHMKGYTINIICVC